MAASAARTSSSSWGASCWASSGRAGRAGDHLECEPLRRLVLRDPVVPLHALTLRPPEALAVDGALARPPGRRRDVHDPGPPPGVVGPVGDEGEDRRDGGGDDDHVLGAWHTTS